MPGSTWPKAFTSEVRRGEGPCGCDYWWSGAGPWGQLEPEFMSLSLGAALFILALLSPKPFWFVLSAGPGSDCSCLRRFPWIWLRFYMICFKACSQPFSFSILLII